MKPSDLVFRSHYDGVSLCMSLCALLIEICVAFERRWTVIKHAPMSQFTKEQPNTLNEKINTKKNMNRYTPFGCYFCINQRVPLISIKILEQINLEGIWRQKQNVSCEPKDANFKEQSIDASVQFQHFRIITKHEWIHWKSFHFFLSFFFLL